MILIERKSVVAGNICIVIPTSMKNSSSGVSSDQEKTNSSSSNTTTKFVTYLPVESSTPITKKTYDSESSESSFDSNPQNEQKITTMKKMLHPKLAAIFDLPTNQHGNYSSQTLPNKSKLKKVLSTSNTNQSGQNNSNNSSERSISESLALINGGQGASGKQYF